MQLPIIPPEYKQFLTKRNLVILGITAIILVSLPIGLYLVQNRQNLFSKAVGSAISIKDGAEGNIITKEKIVLEICPPEGCGGSGDTSQGTSARCELRPDCKGGNSCTFTYDFFIGDAKQNKGAYKVTLTPDINNPSKVSGWVETGEAITHPYESGSYTAKLEVVTSKSPGYASCTAAVPVGGASCDASSGRGLGCSCTSGNQCATNYCSGLTSKCQTTEGLQITCKDTPPPKDARNLPAEACCTNDEQCGTGPSEDPEKNWNCYSGDNTCYAPGKSPADKRSGCDITAYPTDVGKGKNVTLVINYHDKWRSDIRLYNRLDLYEYVDKPDSLGTKESWDTGEYTGDNHIIISENPLGQFNLSGDGVVKNSRQQFKRRANADDKTVYPPSQTTWTAQENGTVVIGAHLWIENAGDSGREESRNSHAYCTTEEIEVGAYDLGGNCTLSSGRKDGCDCDDINSQCSSNNCKEGSCAPK